MKKPIIIVVGHEKGGTGKSTISNHLSIGMLYANPNMKIAIIDTDVRQATTNVFFTARNNFSKDLIQPTFRLIKLSTNDSKEKSLIEDYVLLTTLLAEFSDYDLIIIDTAGSYSNPVILSLLKADILLTPVTDSFLDIDVLVRISDKNLVYGPYTNLVFEKNQERLLKDIPPIKWFLIRNRAPSTAHTNSDICLDLLTRIGKNINASLLYTIKERVVYKEMFRYGLTIFDIIHLYANEITTNRLYALEEMNNFIELISKEIENIYI